MHIWKYFSTNAGSVKIPCAKDHFLPCCYHQAESDDRHADLA